MSSEEPDYDGDGLTDRDLTALVDQFPNDQAFLAGTTRCYRCGDVQEEQFQAFSDEQYGPTQPMTCMSCHHASRVFLHKGTERLLSKRQRMGGG